jgi:hypothetical protein
LVLIKEVPMPQLIAALAPHHSTVTHSERVADRFCGPPGSGNGGYTVGMLGKYVGHEVEVTLKRPIPLDDALQVQVEAEGRATLGHRSTGIASARHAELDIDIPEAVSFSDASVARSRFPGFDAHPFPACFVCGTARCQGDGMCLFTGVVDEGLVASSWVPSAEFASAQGLIAPELICSALDCPGAWALIDRYGIEGPMVLGRMTYRLERPIRADERYVVMGWALGREGRKTFCGTGVYDAEGTVCAVAGATWFQLG